ncbi:MAG: hypothetical protein IPP48_09365 [Chitinophagaceae bacterium]|nr:hypothetical protein [Chitinophagaceae bacterium]
MKKINILLLCTIGIIVFQNCSSSKNTNKVVTTPALSFDKDIMPVMKASCTPCHFPPDGRKKALDSYETVKNNIADIIARVKLTKEDIKFMPFKNKKPALSDSAIKVLEQWQKQNMPQ